MSVEVVHWNPSRPAFTGRLGRRLPIRRPVNNFGDLIGPLVVDKVREGLGLAQAARQDARLLSVGSILHFARPGDVVWGSGINGKTTAPITADLDVRAVRGPLTRARLRDLGVTVPEVYGDPALLWPRLFGAALPHPPTIPRHPVTVVPNLHDWPRHRRDPRAVSPREPITTVVARIAASDFVVASSLHGVVIADALGVPARLIAASAEASFKYDDYLLGTGRAPYVASADVVEALRAGAHPPLDWDPEPLLAAFPRDLWAPPASD